MSILAFFKVVQGPGLWNEAFDFPEKDDFHIALWIFIFSILCFCIVFPLFYVTISNAVKNVTTAERFGGKKKRTKNTFSSMKSSLLSDVSDSPSMLRVDDEDTLGFSNFTDTMLKEAIAEEKSCWCFKKKKSVLVHQETNSSFAFMNESQTELQSEY